MDNALEASSQRIRNHLRAPIPGRGELLNENARNTVNEIVPYVVLAGIVEVCGFTCYAIGAQYGVAVTSVLASQFAPIAAIMAYLLYKEKLGKVQIAGVAIIVAGVVTLVLL